MAVDTVARPADRDYHWRGAHLPGDRGQPSIRRRDSGQPKVVAECFRCTEDRRKLLSVRIVNAGSTLGTALLCGECIAALQPLDPDPLDATEVD